MQNRNHNEERIEKIQAYAQQRSLDADRKRVFERKAVSALTKQVKQLQPRIEALIRTANACLAAGISIDRAGDSLISYYDTYENGTFITNGISHRLGFVYAPMTNKQRVDELGIDAGGVCGEWDFRTNGKQVYSNHRKEWGCHREPQRKHLEQFLNSFDRFEAAFYADVDKTVGGEECAKAASQEAQKKLVFRNEHGSIELDDFTYEPEYHAYWGGICKECFDKHKKLLENNIDDGGGSGICSVMGCNNEAFFYADFMEEAVTLCDASEPMQQKESMDLSQFMEFINTNFTISGEAMRFAHNIVEYAIDVLDGEADKKQFLGFMFAGTIGITEAELDLLSLTKEEPCD